MGYEVTVAGSITFKDVAGFRKEFEKVAQHRMSEIGMHGDFDYFFTKMWGEHLERLDANDGVETKIYRDGNAWYDENKAVELLAKYAYGTLEFKGEEGEMWRYIISEDGSVKQQTGENVWKDVRED